MEVWGSALTIISRPIIRNDRPAVLWIVLENGMPFSCWILAFLVHVVFIVTVALRCGEVAVILVVIFDRRCRRRLAGCFLRGLVSCPRGHLAFSGSASSRRLKQISLLPGIGASSPEAALALFRQPGRKSLRLLGGLPRRGLA